MLAYKRHFPMQRTYCRNFGHVSPTIHWAYQIQTDLDKIQPFQISILFVLNSFINKQRYNNAERVVTAKKSRAVEQKLKRKKDKRD